MGIDEDALGRAVGDEGAVNIGDGAAFGGAGVELAVGKGAGAALAEAVVGVFDHAAFAGERGEVEAAGGGVFAALKDDGFEAKLDEAQGGEEAGGAGADDNDAGGVGREGGVVGRGQGLGRERGVEADVETELDLDVALASVYGVFAQAEVVNAVGGDAEVAGGGGAARGIILGSGEGEEDVDAFDARGGHVRE